MYAAAAADVLSSYYIIFLFFWVMCVCGAVSGGERGVPAHSACAEHERGWEAEDNVRYDIHQGYRQEIRQHLLQEGRRRHEQEVRFLVWFGWIALFVCLFLLLKQVCVCGILLLVQGW